MIEIEVRQRLAKKMKRINTITSVVEAGLIVSTVTTGGGGGGPPNSQKFTPSPPPPPPLKNPPRRLLSIKFLFSLLNESMRGKSMQTEAKT